MTEFVEWLTGTHKCDCGARYTVTVTRVTAVSVTCEKCDGLPCQPELFGLCAYIGGRMTESDAAGNVAYWARNGRGGAVAACPLSEPKRKTSTQSEYFAF
jgi:hypothetical protein